MLDIIQNEFSIRDLENLSRVSAHTIRKWETRYNVFSPARTDTNIRRYTNEDLKKLLTIADLQRKGYKISKIVGMSDEEQNRLLEITDSGAFEYADVRNTLIKAILSFDSITIESCFNELGERLEFPQLFGYIIAPLLQEIGQLWQTASITVAHEHFISGIIRHKMILNIEKAIPEKPDSDQLYLLFLPAGELHEIGLMYLHYYLLSMNKQSIYLGQSIEIRDLAAIRSSRCEPITYISYFTVAPEERSIHAYLETFSNELLQSGDSLFASGRKLQDFDSRNLPCGINIIPDMQNLIKSLN